MISLFLLCAFSAISFAKQCDKLGVLIYEDMKCDPTFDRRDECPSSYSCQGLRPSSRHCYYKGREYGIGELVPYNASVGCDVGCSCSGRRSSTEFNCAIVECAEFGPPLAKGCYYQYTLDGCCGTPFCPELGKGGICSVEGKTYLEGQKFFPTDSCLSCVCQRGFAGKFEKPFCKRMHCGVQPKYSDKLQAGCSPVYQFRDDNPEKLRCCPSSWVCPDGTESIRGHSTSHRTCKFGSKTVKVGQHLEKRVTEYGRTKRYNCECNVPPLLSCTLEN